MHRADLAPLSDVSFAAVRDALAVGWLDPAHPFNTGDVPPECFRRLAALAVDPWQPSALAGSHPCAFCRFSGGPGRVIVDGHAISVGASNVFIPSENAVFVVPSLAIHYIDAHGYAPPEPFWDAVMACPPMRSIEYLKAMARHLATKTRTR